MTNIFKLNKQANKASDSSSANKNQRSSRLSNIFDAFKISASSLKKGNRQRTRSKKIDHETMVDAARKII